MNIDLTEVVDLVRQKEVRKVISPGNILSNWYLVQQDKHNELAAIHYSEALEDIVIATQLQRLQFAKIAKSILMQ